jgi:Ca2+-binding RTX toxin-like protein
MSTNNLEPDSGASHHHMPTLRQIFWGPLANHFRRMAQWRRQGVLGEALKAYRRRSMRFETLEPRLLLSADLSHSAAAGVALDATLKVTDVDGAVMVQLIDNQSSAVLEAAALDQDINVTVLGNDMSDVLMIAFDRGSLAYQVKVTFDGGDGDGNELVGPDQAHTWNLGAPDTGTIDDVSFVSFSKIQHVKGGTGANTFVVLDPTTTTAVEGGAGNNTLVGADADNAWSVSGADSGTLNGQSFSNIQNVAGGSGQDTFTIAPGGKVTGTVSGGGGNDTLVAADQDNSWTVTGSNAGALNGTVFADIENLAGGSGDDSFTFGPGGILSGTLSGGGGNDTLAAADNDNTWVISGANAGTLNGTAFTGIENLRGGAGADTFIFAGGSISGSIDGGGGTNTFDYSLETGGITVDLHSGAATGAGAMSNINAVVGGAGDDTLVGRDEDSTWTVSAQNAGSVGGVSFASVENLEGGSGNDTFVVSTDGGLTGLLSGGLGEDFVQGADKANTWTVTDPDAGTLNATAFASIENLLGGTDADVFVVMAAGGLSGTMAGGEGVDRVRGPERKTVWRYTGQGSGDVGGTRFSGVEALQAGGDEDTLVGPATDSTWTIDGADSGNVAGVTFSGFENLEGAADNQDTFVFVDGGSLDGALAGGDAGYDVLDVQFSHVGSLSYEATGADSGSVTADGNTISPVPPT